MMTHSLFDIATATRIESTANTISVSSTLTTVAQKADRPSHGRAGLIGATSLRILVSQEVLIRQIQQVEPAEQLHPGDLDHVGRKHGRGNAEGERADNAVAQRFPLLVPRQPQDEHRHHHRVVGTEEAFERHEQPDGDEVSSLNVQHTLPLSICKVLL